MRNLFEIVLLTLIWCGFSNNFSIPTITIGFIIAGVIVIIMNRRDSVKIQVNPLVLAELILLTFYELIKSSIEVALEVLNFSKKRQPEIIEIPLACKNNFQKTILTNLISLTPGTLSIDLTSDKSSLLVHVMFAKSKDQFLHFVKEKLEVRVMRAFYVE